MATNEEIMTKNIEKIKAVINGDVESTTINGAMVCKLDGIGREIFWYTRDGISVSGDRIVISGSFADLMQGGNPVAFLSLTED